MSDRAAPDEIARLKADLDAKVDRLEELAADCAASAEIHEKAHKDFAGARDELADLAYSANASAESFTARLAEARRDADAALAALLAADARLRHAAAPA